MRLFIFFWMTILFFLSCNNNDADKKNIVQSIQNKNEPSTDTILSIDSNKIAILSNSNINFFSLKDSMPAKLTNKDIQLINTLVLNCIKLYNTGKDSTNLYGGYIVEQNYKRQYVAYLDSKKEKKIFVNCFCRGFTNFTKWKTTLLVVDDGGNCFFNTTIDLTNKSFGPLLINGPA